MELSQLVKEKFTPDQAYFIKIIYDALKGGNPDQKRLAEVGLKAISTLIRKNNDYGSAVWNEGKLAKNVPVGAKILVRLDDKFERCSQLLNGKEQMVQDEKVEDTMIDIVNYCLLYLARPDKPVKPMSYDELLYNYQRTKDSKPAPDPRQSRQTPQPGDNPQTEAGPQSIEESIIRKTITCTCRPTCSEMCRGECGCEYHKYIFERPRGYAGY